MAIEESEVRHVAKLAKLSFADHEILHFTEQMSDIIDMVEQLKEVDTTGVEVTTHGYSLVNVLREDVAVKGTDRDLLMKNVPQSQDGYIKVPAIIDESEE